MRPIIHEPLRKATNADLIKLSKLIRPYPVSSWTLVNTARKQSMLAPTIDFLKQFPEDELFDDEEDFLARCEMLELLDEAAREMPFESVHSPQG